jgi:LDH2 family malate/lactate/ureidoglycolate dehydrogenase
MLPGEPEFKMHEKRIQQGIPIPQETWDAVRKAGLTVGVDIDKLA